MQEITGKEAELSMTGGECPAQDKGESKTAECFAQEKGESLTAAECPAQDETVTIAALEAENADMKALFTPLYTKIGQNFYEKTEGYELVIATAVKELAELDEKIHKNYLHILRLKGIRYCPNCERIVDDATVFCGDCGTRIDPPEDVDEGSVRCVCCGAKNSRDKHFCIKCGQKLGETIRCPHCGIQLPADARFCEECGTKIV